MLEDASGHRTNLPNRRASVTLKIEHEGMTFFVTCGYHPETGKILEVFGNAKLQTTSFEYLIADACVAISLALQHGVSPENLLHAMHWSYTPQDGQFERQPASVIGKIVRAIIHEQLTTSLDPKL